LKERKERIRGVGFGEVEKGRGYGQNNHLLPPLPHHTEQRRRGQRGRPVEGGGAPATRCTTTAGKWAKRRGARGQPILLLTLVGDGLWREIDGRRWGCSWWWPGRHWWWQWRAREGGENDHGGAGRGGEPVRPFIGAGRSVWRGYLSSRSFDGCQWWWGEISWH
jgi:hypothetical protein